MKLGFDGQGSVILNMVGYKDGHINEMGLVMPEKSFWGDVLRKTQEYSVWQRRPTRREFNKAFPRRRK